jgi:hypothetical protein
MQSLFSPRQRVHGVREVAEPQVAVLVGGGGGEGVAHQCRPVRRRHAVQRRSLVGRRRAWVALRTTKAKQQTGKASGKERQPARGGEQPGWAPRVQSLPSSSLRARATAPFHRVCRRPPAPPPSAPPAALAASTALRCAPHRDRPGQRREGDVVMMQGWRRHAHAHPQTPHTRAVAPGVPGRRFRRQRRLRTAAGPEAPSTRTPEVKERWRRGSSLRERCRA